MPSLLPIGLTIAIIAVLAAALGTSSPQTLEPLTRCLETEALLSREPCRLTEETRVEPDAAIVRPSTDLERTAPDSIGPGDTELSTL